MYPVRDWRVARIISKELLSKHADYLQREEVKLLTAVEKNGLQNDEATDRVYEIWARMHHVR